MQKPSEVRIRVRAIGLNFADVFAVLGLYPLAGDPPFTPGFEVAGLVDAVGSSVTHVSPGDRVSAITLFNAYTTVINASAHLVRPIPSDWTFSDAAAFPAQAFTAWYALCDLASIRPPTAMSNVDGTRKKRVLIHSAAGGVGLMLVELAKRLHMEPVCTIGRPEKATVLQQRGVSPDRIIIRPTDAPSLEKAVLAAGGPVDVVVDPVLGSLFDGNWAVLRPRGRYIVMGSASLMPTGGLGLLNIPRLLKLGWNYLNRPKVDLINSMTDNKTVAMFNLGGLLDDVELVREGFEQLETLDLPRALIGREMPFDEAHEALRFLQSGRSVGKVVLVVPPEQ